LARRNGFAPHAAPSTGAFERIGPVGAPQGCGALPKGQESPFGNPVQKLRSAGNNKKSESKKNKKDITRKE